jgi:hypothetical protein
LLYTRFSNIGAIYILIYEQNENNNKPRRINVTVAALNPSKYLEAPAGLILDGAKHVRFITDVLLRRQGHVPSF